MSKSTGANLSVLVLAGFLAVPTWEASELATSRSGYLVWALSSSLVATALLVCVSLMVWGRFRRISTAVLVIGAVTVLFGIGLRFSAPVMLERAAPELQQAGTATWVDTAIQDRISAGRGYQTSRSALAATVRLEDGTEVKALSFSRRDERGSSVELHRDLAGTYWVGDPTEEAATTDGVVYVFLGSLLVCVALISRIGPVRRFVLREFDRRLGE